MKRKWQHKHILELAPQIYELTWWQKLFAKEKQEIVFFWWMNEWMNEQSQCCFCEPCHVHCWIGQVQDQVLHKILQLRLQSRRLMCLHMSLFPPPPDLGNKLSLSISSARTVFKRVKVCCLFCVWVSICVCVEVCVSEVFNVHTPSYSRCQAVLSQSRSVCGPVRWCLQSLVRVRGSWWSR